MSGGISAIKGFDYQATVVLDRLLDHFERHGLAAQVRPEGADDLDLSWIENATEYRRYEQIKKEREDDEGNRKPAPWTLTDAINELLPNTITRLLGNSCQQVWIVGDEIHKDVKDLIQAGFDAPTVAGKPYWTVVHRLARNDAIEGTRGPQRTKLQQWRVPDDLASDPANALSRMVREFADFSAKAGGARTLRTFIKNGRNFGMTAYPGSSPGFALRPFTAAKKRLGLEFEIAWKKDTGSRVR